MKRITIIALFLGLILAGSPAMAFDAAPQAMEDDSPTRDFNSETSSLISEEDQSTLDIGPIEGTLFGRIRSTVVYNSYKEGDVDLNYLDTTTDARLGYTVKAKANGWTTSGTINLNIQSADSSIKAKYLYVTLENEQYQFRLGRQEPGGSTLGGKYMQNIDETLTIGETITQGDYLMSTFKDFNLRLVVGKHASKSDEANTDEAVPANDENVMAAFWEYGSDWQYTLSYTNIEERVSRREYVTDPALIHSPERYTGVAMGVAIPMSDVTLSINLNKFRKIHFDAPIAPENKLTTILILDHKLTKSSGYSLSYSKESIKDGSPNPGEYTSLDFGYTYQLGELIRLYAAINQTSNLDADSTNVHTQQIGVGMSAHFK